MIRSLDSGVSAMQQFQQQMDVIGNNIANVDTNGYKTARTDFEDTLSQTLGTGMQVGTGVTTGAIRNEFTQGGFKDGTSQTDMAISGNGFFVLANSVTGSQFASRDGAFHLDKNGYLVNSADLRVQGYSNAALSVVGDVRIDATGAPAGAAAGATVDSFSISSDGVITVRLTDGTQFARGQVLLQDYSNPQALVKEGGDLYSGLTSAGPLTALAAPGANALGRVQSGKLEMSNVDLTAEMSSLIKAQRAFQASARIVTTSDEVLNDVVNLKR